MLYCTASCCLVLARIVFLYVRALSVFVCAVLVCVRLFWFGSMFLCVCGGVCLVLDCILMYGLELSCCVLFYFAWIRLLGVIAACVELVWFDVCWVCFVLLRCVFHVTCRLVLCCLYCLSTAQVCVGLVCFVLYCVGSFVCVMSCAGLVLHCAVV